MMSIEFDFQLTGSGWCEAYISDGHRWLRPTASHLSDAPMALLSAVVAVLRGHSPVACFWSEEPGEYVWIFIRNNGNVELRILWHDDWIDQPSDSDNWFTPFDSLLDEQAGFALNMRIGDLRGAVLRGMESMIKRVGLTEYENRWGMPFPEREYAELRQRAPDRA
jgi:hypothetical protein